MRETTRTVSVAVRFLRYCADFIKCPSDTNLPLISSTTALFSQTEDFFLFFSSKHYCTTICSLQFFFHCQILLHCNKLITVACKMSAVLWVSVSKWLYVKHKHCSDYCGLRLLYFFLFYLRRSYQCNCYLGRVLPGVSQLSCFFVLQGTCIKT